METAYCVTFGGFQSSREYTYSQFIVQSRYTTLNFVLYCSPGCENKMHIVTRETRF